MMSTSKLLKTLCAVFCFAILTGSAHGQNAGLPPAGGGTLPNQPLDELSEEWRAQTFRAIRDNADRLKREGRLPNVSAQAVALGWPVEKVNDAPGFYLDAISNYVDLNPAYPNMVLDYNCGNRSYDTAAGYNHKGIDIITWPFSWFSMDHSYVKAVAAASGTIIGKSDGNPDRSCSLNSNPVNALYLQHTDGSIAWYLHFKKNSVTAKNVGDTVAQGEFIGLVGSSGSSTEPHLHFELYDAANKLMEPFQGMCNTLNNFSWWAAQPAYRLSRINRLMVHFAPPVFPSCPTDEVPNEATTVLPGTTMYTAAYYRDQVSGQTTQYAVLRPDGSVFSTWSHTSPDTYTRSWWYWQWNLPQNAPIGIWKFRATYQGQTSELLFKVDLRRRKGQTTSTNE